MSKPRTGKFINCLHCSKSFYIPINRISTALYCSRKCQSLHNTVKIKSTCEVCSNEFEHISSRCNKAKYCSRTCYYKAQSLKGSIIKTCPCCDKKFNTSPSRNKVFCSRKCVVVGKQTNHFKTRLGIRKALLARGLIKQCADCGYTDHIEILGIHHNDHNNKNNLLENLIVLCPNCHSLRHSKHIPH